MKVFQRACVRGGVEVAHTEGFNPRPRMSLPLPRSVGVESDAELLGLVISCEGDEATVAEFDCELVSATGVRGGKTPLPVAASYLLKVTPEYIGDELKNRIKDLPGRDSIVVSRQGGKKASRPKDVDVRGFLKSVELDDGCVSFECEINSGGSIRMEEILDILGLDIAKLARPIKRASVQWRP